MCTYVRVIVLKYKVCYILYEDLFMHLPIGDDLLLNFLQGAAERTPRFGLDVARGGVEVGQWGLCR
jgi:hypothetical protein